MKHFRKRSSEGPVNKQGWKGRGSSGLARQKCAAIAHLNKRPNHTQTITPRPELMSPEYSLERDLQTQRRDHKWDFIEVQHALDTKILLLKSREKTVHPRARGMAQHGKVSAKPDDTSSNNPWDPHSAWKERSDSGKLSSDLYMHTMAHVCTHTHIHTQINVIKNKLKKETK